ncbi:MAG: hypothetical protein RLZZ306_395 [Bacteroidota bacterium]|jgi:hypothetical protein
MEQTPSPYRPVSRPRPKMKMPLFGNMLGGSGSGPKRSNEEPHPLTKNIVPIIIILAIIAFGIDYFRKSNVPKTSFRGQNEVKEAAFEGKILRKWYNVIPPENDVEYVVEIQNNKGEKKIVSFLNEKSSIGDFVLPYNSISKTANSLDITVKRYNKTDSTLTLKY